MLGFMLLAAAPVWAEPAVAPSETPAPAAVAQKDPLHPLTQAQREKIKSAMAARFRKMMPDERARHAARLTQSLERVRARPAENKAQADRLAMELDLLKSVE
ncbi:MAG: hypothetical protein PHX68_05105 [Alphaproteobacteria bacterium]|nr:hypothetical protein [Alphaproteobacteria bacterium]